MDLPGKAFLSAAFLLSGQEQQQWSSFLRRPLVRHLFIERLIVKTKFLNINQDNDSFSSVQ